jgi:hypothetical protein
MWVSVAQHRKSLLIFKKRFSYRIKESFQRLTSRYQVQQRNGYIVNIRRSSFSFKRLTTGKQKGPLRATPDMQMSESICAYYLWNFWADLSFRIDKFSTLHQDENEGNTCSGHLLLKNLRAFSPQANCTDRATAAC